jgi:hypothetical protein
MGEGPYSNIRLAGTRETALANRIKSDGADSGSGAQVGAQPFFRNGCLIEMSSWRYLCVCLYNPAATLRNEICEVIPLWLRARDRGRRCASRLSVRSQSGFSMLTMVRVLKLGLLLNRITTRTVSSTSTLQHRQTSAVRRCAAVVKEMPNPPPSASQAAIHMGHFGTSASAMLGNAKAAAPRVRRTARL